MPIVSFEEATAPAPVPKTISFEEATGGGEAPGFLDHMGNLLSNSPMIGTIPPEIIPEHPGKQLAIGANMGLYNAPMTFYRSRMMDADLRKLPDNQQALRELEADRIAAGGLIKEYQKDDNAAARLVGDALQSVPGSLTSILPFAAGVPAAPALTLGLGANFALETAGDFTHRTADLKQSPEDAEIPSLLHGGVATGLEMGPLGAIGKYLKGQASLGKTLVKVGTGNAAQEGLTTVYDDLATNYEGLTKITFEQGVENAAKSAATGLIMSPMIGAVVKPVQMAQEYDAKRQVKSALDEVVKRAEEAKKQLRISLEQVQREQFESMEAPARLQRSMEEAVAPVTSTVPLTPAEERTATIVREQMRNGLDVPPVKSQTADSLNEVVGKLLATGGVTLEDAAAPDEGGVSPEVFARRQRDYVAMEGSPDTWPIIASRDPKVTGMTIGQVGELPPGSITVIGRDDENWPGYVTDAMMGTLGEWTDKFLPGSRVVLLQIPFTPETQDDTMGWHKIDFTDTGPIHYIVPRDMKSLGVHGKTDNRTALNMIGGLTHEFGHAVEQQGFWEVLTERVGAQLAQQFYGETLSGNFTDATLAAMQQTAPQEVALAQNWLEQRSRMLDGTMLAREYLETWAGLRKSGAAIEAKLPENKSLYYWANERAKLMHRPLDGMTAKELLLGKPTSQHTIGDMREMLRLTSFSEYMAEQFTRAAYAKGYLAKTPLGQMFERTLNRLRELFRFLKTTKGTDAEPLIAAHVTFQDWLDGITARAAKMKKPKGKVTLTAKARAAQKKILAQKTLQQEVDEVVEELEGDKELPPPPEQVPPSQEDQNEPSAEEVLAQVEAAIDGDTAWVETKQQAAKLRGMVKRGKLEEVMQILDDGHFDKVQAVRREEMKEERKPALPEVTTIDVAGLTQEELMKPEMVSLASQMYKSQGENSPFFLRWFRSGTRGRDGKALKVFRGSHSKITFLDRESLGYHTGAEDATKAFWASDSLNNASYYAEGSAVSKHPVVKAEYRREQQRLRKAVNDARELLRREGLTKQQRAKLWAALGDAEADLQSFTEEPGKSVSASPSVSELFLRLENPLEKDAGGGSYSEELWTSWVNEAMANGHDGLIIKNALDPRPGTVYAFFQPEQAKDLANIGTFDDTDRLHWDRDQPVQAGVEPISKMLKGWIDNRWQTGMNLAAKAVDSIMQIQQTAAAQPEEAFLNGFVGLLRRSGQMASDLQFPAEEVVSKMIGSTPHTVKELQRVMTAEWKGGLLMGELQGLDENGVVVWGAEVGRGPENLQTAIDWRIVDSIGLREFLTMEGIDVESATGEKVIELYLGVRNTFLHQFRGLEIALREKASRAYGNAPLVLRQEYFKIDQLISKYRILPFLPQGHFGNHVVLVQKKRSWEEAKMDNRRRFVTVRRMHFENKAEADKAFVEMKKLEGNGEYKVRTRVLDDSRYGIPMQLPREFLEQVAATGEFTDDNIELLADLMVTGKYEKIEAKYDKISEKVEGGNEDFQRVFSNYTWHNANYVWKTYYRSAMQNMLSMARTEVRQVERSGLAAEEMVKVVGKKRRNIAMMEKSLSYIMHPEDEMQQMKLMITLTYLAFNVKTAVMNLSTQLNTFAALGTEYGEWKGANLYKKGLWYTANAFRLSQMSGEGKTASEKEAMDVRSMIDQAVRQGVLDQSYAYFLAGQANASGGLHVSSNSWLGRAAHASMELGMLPFRMTEKANRYSTLISFYLAERQRGIDGVRAYETAVKKVDLLQNSYSAGNRPELFRGKKGILFMFASFSQFQGWVMTGGYERSARAGARAEGRSSRSAWTGTTMKLWLFYLMLGGGLGLPFGQNVLDLVQFVWRRLFGNPENIEMELRAFIKDLGGDPNLALHGAFHNFLGFNLSGSFGLGRLLPFTDVLNRQFSSVDAAIGKGVQSFAGPAGNFWGSMLGAVGQLVQGEPLEAAKEMPGAIGSAGKFVDTLVKQQLDPGEGQGVTLKNGTRLTRDPETGEFRDLTGVELAGMALGAVPALVAENRQLAFAQQGEVLYWTMRRQDLKDKWRKARMQGDEKEADVWRDKIDGFNETTPDPALRITGKELAQGLKASRKSSRNMENFGTMQKKMRGVVEEVGEGY